MRNELIQNQSSTIQKSNRPILQRSLFTLGLLCKHFDFENDLKPQNNVSIANFKIHDFFNKHEINFRYNQPQMINLK